MPELIKKPLTGLDLSEYYYDVVKIVHSKFSDQSTDTEDLIQDICVKILRLNQGSSPYDPAKAKPSTYIYMVAKGVVIKQYHRKEIETEMREIKGFTDWNEAVLSSFESFLKETLPFDDILPRRVFLLLRMGYTRREIASLLEETMYQIRKQKQRLAELAFQFMDSSPKDG